MSGRLTLLFKLSFANDWLIVSVITVVNNNNNNNHDNVYGAVIMT